VSTEPGDVQSSTSPRASSTAQAASGHQP